MSRSRPSGMTLLEVCVSLMIIGIVFAASVPFAKDAFTSHPLEIQLDDFRELIYEAGQSSVTHQQTVRFRFEKRQILVTFPATGNNDEQEPQTMTVTVPKDVGYQIRLWPQNQWIQPEDLVWEIPPAGLLLPLDIKWTMNDSWLAASVDPMTADLTQVSYELH